MTSEQIHHFHSLVAPLLIHTLHRADAIKITLLLWYIPITVIYVAEWCMKYNSKTLCHGLGYCHTLRQWSTDSATFT